MNEAVGAVPVLHHVQPLLDFTPQRFGAQVATEKDRFTCLAQFRQGFVGRMLNVVLGEAAQDRFGIGGSQPKGGCVLDHFIVLLTNQIPINRAGQCGLQMRIVARFSCLRAIRVSGGAAL